MDKERIRKMKEALLHFTEANGRPYVEKSKLENEVDDLIAILFMKLERMERGEEKDVVTKTAQQRIRERLSSLAGAMAKGEEFPLLTAEVADEFEKILDLLDAAKIAKIKAESQAIKYKRK